MINLNESIAFEFSPFTEKDYIIKYFIFQEGIGGVLPRLRLALSNYNDSVDTNEIDCKVQINKKIVINSKAYVYQRTYDTELSLILDCYLVPLEFVYESNTYGYESMDEILSMLWKGKTSGIDSNSTKSYFTQAKDVNHEYLSKALYGWKSKFAFCYNLNGELVGKNIDDNVDLEIKKGDSIYSIVNSQFNLKYNPLENKESESSKFSLIYPTYLLNTYRMSDPDSEVIYMNYMENRKWLLRHNESLVLQYYSYGSIKIGDLVSIQISDTLTKKYRAMYTQFHYKDAQVISNTQLGLINE